jgi:hypothetical protein
MTTYCQLSLSTHSEFALELRTLVFHFTLGHRGRPFLNSIGRSLPFCSLYQILSLFAISLDQFTRFLCLGCRNALASGLNVVLNPS